MKNKKAIELSINFLVVMIISITLFIFGLYFAKKILSMSNKVIEQGLSDKQLLALETCLNSGKHVCLSEREGEVRSGKVATFGVGIFNDLDENNELRKIHSNGDILTSRGCPYLCKFCACYTIWGTRTPRTRSVENIMQEVEQIVKTYGQKSFIFWDDLFTANKKRVIHFCEELLKRDLDIDWICLARLNNLDREMLDIMKKYRISSILTAFFIISFITQAFLACQKSTCSVEENLSLAENFEIHLQIHFDNIYVFIKIDDKSIFSGEVNTNYVVGLAAIISPQITKGEHNIKVYIENIEADTTFSVQDSLIIGITYDESVSEISFYFYEPPNHPFYD